MDTPQDLPPQQPTTPPGWYPTNPGMQGYWDGTRWTGDTAPLTAPPMAGTSDENTMAMLCHLLAIFTGFLGPLILFLVKKDESQYVRHHAAESLNFQISLIIVYIVTAILFLVIIGFLLLPVVIIGSLVLEIMASVAANRGEWYRYPLNIRFVS